MIVYTHMIVALNNTIINFRVTLLKLALNNIIYVFDLKIK